MTEMSTEESVQHAISTLIAALRDGRLTINALDDGSGVLLDLEREQLMTLNTTGMVLVQAIERGAASPAELVATLVQQFEVPAETAGNDLDAFLRELHTALAG